MASNPRSGPPTLPAGAVAVRAPSGLEIFEIEAGSGPKAERGRTVRVSYRAWLAEGPLVDDTDAGEGPVEFRLGDSGILPALGEGVEGMRPGARRRLIAPSDLAYGSAGRGGSVPPYATLIFDVALLAVL